MSETTHSPEPWHWEDRVFEEDRVFIWRGEFREHQVTAMRVYDAEDGAQETADARRIVACVNALAGVPTDLLERADATLVKAMLMSVRNVVFNP